MFNFLKIDRRIITAGVLLALLGTVAVANQLLSRGDRSNAGQPVAAFASYRSERNLSRQNEIDVLDGIIQSADTATDIRSQAQTTRMALAGRIQTELDIETQLKTKGFSDCVVHYTENSASVMVNQKVLTAAQVAQVVEAVTTRTTLTAMQITIIPAV